MLHREDPGQVRLRVLQLGRDQDRHPPRRALLRHRPGELLRPGRDRRHPENAWTPIRYPQAVWDDQLDSWISDAEIAETRYTAFTSKPKSEQVTARLIVRRVRARNEKQAQGQDELFPAYRHHAAFTDSPFETLQAEGQHRDHAVVEQVIADLNAGPLARLPSGHFAANAAWLVLAAIVHNLLRTAGTRAGTR